MLDSESQDPLDVQMYQLKETHALVEEFMLLANITVSSLLLVTAIDSSTSPCPSLPHSAPLSNRYFCCTESVPSALPLLMTPLLILSSPMPPSCAGGEEDLASLPHAVGAASPPRTLACTIRHAHRRG